VAAYSVCYLVLIGAHLKKYTSGDVEWRRKSLDRWDADFQISY
jgi:hypothetical protein